MLPEIIRNDAGLYEGDLRHYFRTLFLKAQNLSNPYHNFRHMLHVVWLCYQACRFYGRQLTPRQMRNLLIAAMFHDFNHPGMAIHDDLNIAIAIRGFQENLAKQDVDHRDEIIKVIRGSEFPHHGSSVTLEIGILRDADLAQALNPAWIQQVVFGLAAEWNKEPIELLKLQIAFAANLSFRTAWAQQTFPQCVVKEKIREAEQLLEILG